MSAACGQAELVIATLRFLQCHVFVHESLYLHYLRRYVGHFDASHSSPHEGTNLGIKNHAAPVQPTMNLDTSSTTLNLQANLKAAKLDAKLHLEFANTHKLWSNSPSAPYLLSFGEALMVAENRRTADKSTRRIGSSVFEVTYTPRTDAPSLEETVDTAKKTPKSKKKKKEKDHFTNVPLSLFHRVRVVKVSSDGVMTCSCSKFESRGHPCADHMCVAKYVSEALGKEFRGFTHHDVALRYWNAYMHLAYKDSSPPTFRKIFTSVRRMK